MKYHLFVYFVQDVYKRQSLSSPLATVSPTPSALPTPTVVINNKVFLPPHTIPTPVYDQTTTLPDSSVLGASTTSKSYTYSCGLADTRVSISQANSEISALKNSNMCSANYAYPLSQPQSPSTDNLVCQRVSKSIDTNYPNCTSYPVSYTHLID